LKDDPNIIDFTRESEAAKSESAALPESAALADEELEEEKSELAEFPIECLPPVLANMAKAISELGRWPLRLTAPLVLAAASASLGRGIRVNSYNGHETRPNIYLLVGKESGSGGTSAFRFAFTPVFGFQALKRREFANGLKPILEGDRATHEAEIEYLKRQARGKKSADERREIGKQISKCVRVIAGDLVALYRNGAIRAADDPEARFYAALLVLFEARYAVRASSKETPGDSLPSTGRARLTPLPLVK
jgi:hypothetical protein